MALHLYRVSVEFPAAVWSIVVSLPDPPKVGDPIDVKGTACVVREVELRHASGAENPTVEANVYADPAGDP